MWRTIQSQIDIDYLIEVFGNFHDSCVREIHVSAGDYVNPDLSMSSEGVDAYKLHILIQRQYKKPSAMEMCFEGVDRFNYVTPGSNFMGVIYDATFVLIDDFFYWAEVEDWVPERTDRNDFTWISARRVKWRDASLWMGDGLRYRKNKDEEF